VISAAPLCGARDRSPPRVRMRAGPKTGPANTNPVRFRPTSVRGFYASAQMVVRTIVLVFGAVFALWGTTRLSTPLTWRTESRLSEAARSTTEPKWVEPSAAPALSAPAPPAVIEALRDRRATGSTPSTRPRNGLKPRLSPSSSVSRIVSLPAWTTSDLPPLHAGNLNAEPSSAASVLLRPSKCRTCQAQACFVLRRPC
jgi:hypothetical protein